MENQRKLLKDRGICVVIPVYNNERTIQDVVKRSLENCFDVIVVNDGSTDSTGGILRGISGITLVEYPENKGKGHALKCGFKKALELGFSYAITLDGDGQHFPEDIAKFLKANIEHPGSIIVGHRNLDGVERRKGSGFANKFANFWFTVQTFKRLDTQSGFRLYPIKKIHGLNILSARYEAELEILVLSSWHGVDIFAVPVNVSYPEDRVSHFRPGRDFLRISVLNTILCIVGLVYALPLGILRFLFKYLKTFYAVFVFFVCSVVFITPGVWLYVKIGKMTEKKQLGLHKFIQNVAKFIMVWHGVPGAKFSHKIHEKADLDTPKVIICNHQSVLDAVCQLIFNPKIIFLTNNRVWNNPFYGFVIRNAEYYPVTDGIDKLIPELQDLVKRGYSIAVYPEGTRSTDCKIGRFHQGAFYIAKQLGVDILPMCIYGTGKVLPKNAWLLRKSPVYIEVSEPFSRESLDEIGDELQQASFMRKKIREKYSELSNRIEQNV